MGLATALAWAGWIFVIFMIDPEEAGLAGLLLFYVTLFASLIGTLTIAGIAYRIRVLKRQQVVSREVKIAVRHAIMFALVSVVSLALSAQGSLTWWNLFALMAGVSVVEYVFLIIQESHRR